jgi:hypothetical protein
MEGSDIGGRLVWGVAFCALGAVCACGGSPESLSDGAGDPQNAAATTTPSGPAATQKGAAAICAQGTLRACTVQLPSQGSVHQCFSGKQLCSAGAWTDCQDPSVLFGVRFEPFAASCPAGASGRWTTLDYVVDAPANASGSADATITVEGHPEIVLFATGSAGAASAGEGTVDLGPLLDVLANQAKLTLQISTTTTPDGALAATARATLKYACSTP